MNKDNEYYFEDEETLQVVHRFEDMLKNKTSLYFDVSEFEEIIEFYLENNQLSHASKATNCATKQHPYSIAIQLKKAQLFLDKAQIDEAIALLSIIEKKDPYNAEVYMAKGWAYSRLEDKLRTNLNFEKAISLVNEGKDEVYFQIAYSFERIEEYKEAIYYLEQAYKLNPTNQSVLFDLAFCYEKVNKDQISIKFYHKLLKIAPNTEAVWYNLGVIYGKQQNLEKSIECYDRCISIEPEYISAYFNKANMLAGAAYYEEALSVYQTILQFSPENSEALCYMAECYEKLRKFKQAIHFYNESLRFDQQMSDSWFGLGMVNMLQGKYIESINYIKRAIELNAEDFEYHFTIANIYAELGEFSLSHEAYKVAINLFPLDQEIWLNYSEVLYRQHRYEEAVWLLKKALDSVLPTPSAYILFRLAAYCFVSGKPQAGTSYLHIALQTNSYLYEELFTFYPQGRTNKSVIRLIEKYQN